MSRLDQEMKVIPRPAWAIAVVMGVVCLAVMFLYGMAEIDNGSGFRFPPLFAVILGSFFFVIFCTWVLLIGYIYGDARRRGMRAVLWVLLAIFIPNAIGILLYFILREPMLQACPRCGTGVKPAFPFCPSCGASLASTCPSCRSAVEPGWTHCARCGASLQVVSPGPH